MTAMTMCYLQMKKVQALSDIGDEAMLTTYYSNAFSLT